MPTLGTTSQHSIRISSQSNKERKRKKRHPNWKGEIKLSPFADDMILYEENPNNFTKKPVRTNRQIQHINRIQNQLIKISCTSVQ